MYEYDEVITNYKKALNENLLNHESLNSRAYFIGLDDLEKIIAVKMKIFIMREND